MEAAARNILGVMSTTPSAQTLSEEDRRTLAPWAADCAERVLGRYEADSRTDARPRRAIEGLRAFALGDRPIGELRRLAFDAHAAARAAEGPAARAAARAAGQAAGVAHMAGHAYAAAAYAVMAATTDATDPQLAMETEVRWQYRMASPAAREVLRRLTGSRHAAGESGEATSLLVSLLEGAD